MTKKLFTLLLAVAASVGTMFAESGPCGYNLTWNLTGKVLTISGTGAMFDYYSDTTPWYSYRSSITTVIIKDGVTSIGEDAFRECTGLTSVTIGNSVTSIGSDAFSGCTGLTSVTIPNSVTNIGDYAFDGCSSLTSVTIPNSVTSIGHNAFYNCSSLTSVTIPNRVTSIERSAFSRCSSLTSVTIPNGVTSIGEDAFSGCSAMTSITIPSSVTSIGEDAFGSIASGYCTALTRVNITNLSAWCNISFGNNLSNPLCFAHHLYLNGAEVKNVIIPSNKTDIGNYTFAGCSGLTSITIPSSITSIGQEALSGCSGLTSIEIPNSVTIIGREAFCDCTNLNSVNIPNSVTSIEYGTFRACSSLTSITIPNSVTSIGDRAFYGCTGLTSVAIGNSVTSIGTNAFYNCSSLTSVTIGNSVTSIETNAFSGCSVNTINFTGTLEDWLNKVWSPVYISNNYKLKINGVLQENIIIPNSVINIGDNAFNGCNSLASIEIPNSVTSIGDGAFGSCSGLFSVTINSDSIVSKSNLRGIFGSQVTQYIIGDGVTSIGEDAFRDCTGLTSVTIGNSVTSIGTRAFYNCSSLTSVTIPNSVTSIGKEAFSRCTGLTSVTIPNSVTSIEDGAFGSCSGLFSVTINSDSIVGKSYLRNRFGTQVKEYIIGDGVTSIGQDAFRDCTGLTSVAIPNSVTSIGNAAFSGCSSLTSVTIPNSVTSIGDRAFYGCTGLTSVIWNAKNCADFASINTPFYSDWLIYSFDLRPQITSFTFGNEVEHIPAYLCNGMSNLTSIEIPNSVTSIGSSAFSGCSSLTSVTIPNSVTSIGYEAFWDCIGLTSIEIPNSVTSIGVWAFAGCSGLISVTIPNSVTSIEDKAFYGCTGLTSVTIGNSVTSIGEDAFRDCTGLTSVTIPNSVTSIWYSAFENCTGLTSVTIPNSVTRIEDDAFENSGVETINFIGSIEDWCNKIWSPVYISNNYKLKINGVLQENIIIPNSVTSIGEDAFRDCTGLTSVTIPNSVTSIEDDAFYGCIGLISVTCLAPTPPTCWSSTCFSGVNCSNIPLYVPMESVSLYQAADIWEEFNVIGVMFADEVETAVFSATPTDDYGVILEWQAVENAVLYNIDIIQGNDTVRQLQFDSNGKLLNSPSNAPSRYPNIHHASTAILSGNGWRYKVNDLDPGTNYTCSITVKAENGSVLYTQSIDFTTKEETFIIKFVNWNGEELLVLPEVVKGTTPSYTGETPVRPNTAEYTYTFVGWTPEIVPATENATYTATFSSVVNVYTISVSAVNGQVIGGGEYQYGATIDLTAIPNEGYVFDQWSDGVKDNPRTITVTGDAEYTALFTSTEGFENIYTSEPVQKVIIDQKVYILRGEKVYTLTGQEVK